MYGYQRCYISILLTPDVAVYWRAVELLLVLRTEDRRSNHGGGILNLISWLRSLQRNIDTEDQTQRANHGLAANIFLSVLYYDIS